MKIWECKIGEALDAELPPGADAPLREAVRLAYIQLVGRPPDYLFTGWGSTLTDTERSVVEMQK